MGIFARMYNSNDNVLGSTPRAKAHSHQQFMSWTFLNLASRGSLGLSKIFHQDTGASSLLLKAVIKANDDAVAKTYEATRVPYVSKIVRELLPDFEQKFKYSVQSGDADADKTKSSITISKTTIEARPRNDDPYGIYDFLESQASDVVDEDFGITLGTNPDDLANGVPEFITSIPVGPTEDAQNDSDRTWTTVVEELQKTHAHEMDFEQQRLDRVINDFDTNLKRQKEKQTMGEASIETLKSAHDKEITLHKSREEMLVQENEELWCSCTEMMKDLYASKYNDITAEEEEDEGEEDETLPTEDTEERLKDAYERIALLEAQHAALESDKNDLASQLSAAKRDANNMRTLAQGRMTQAAPSSLSMYKDVIMKLEATLTDEKRATEEAQDTLDCARKSLRRKIDRYDGENQQLKQKVQGLKTELNCVKSTDKYWNQDFWMSCVRKYAQLVMELSSEAGKLENKINNMGQRYGAVVNADHELHVLLNEAHDWTRAFNQIGANAFPSTGPTPHTDWPEEIDDYSVDVVDTGDDMWEDDDATPAHLDNLDADEVFTTRPPAEYFEASMNQFVDPRVEGYGNPGDDDDDDDMFGDGPATGNNYDYYHREDSPVTSFLNRLLRGNSSQDQAIDVGGFVNPELAGEDDEAEAFMKELLVEDPEEETEEGSEEEDSDEDGSVYNTSNDQQNKRTKVDNHQTTNNFGHKDGTTAPPPPPVQSFSPPPTSGFGFSVTSNNPFSANTTSPPSMSPFNFSIASANNGNPSSGQSTSVPQKSAFDFSIKSTAAANLFSVEITSSQSTRSQFDVSTSAANDSSFSTSIEDTSTTSPTQLSNSLESQEDASAEAATPAPNQDADAGKATAEHAEEEGKPEAVPEVDAENQDPEEAAAEGPFQVQKNQADSLLVRKANAEADTKAKAEKAAAAKAKADEEARAVEVARKVELAKQKFAVEKAAKEEEKAVAEAEAKEQATANSGMSRQERREAERKAKKQAAKKGGRR